MNFVCIKMINSSFISVTQLCDRIIIFNELKVRFSMYSWGHRYKVKCLMLRLKGVNLYARLNGLLIGVLRYGSSKYFTEESYSVISFFG